MNIQVLLVEPAEADNFYPFSIMHPVWELRIGAQRMYEIYKNMFNDNIYFNGRKLQLDSFLARNNILQNSMNSQNGFLAVSASIVPDKSFINQLNKYIVDLNKENKNAVFKYNSLIAAVYININPNMHTHLHDDLGSIISNYKIDETIVLDNLKTIEYNWEAIDHCGKMIEEEYEHFENKLHKFSEFEYYGVLSCNKDKILVGNDVKIAPGTVLDAGEGSIIIDDNVKIMPNSVIIGPVYIGRNSIIKVGAKIYGPCSIGETCKIGGEVEDSIIHAYSNKQHEGFLGHAYISEWVNLGADTNNSDLKNTYGEITMRLPNKEVKTGRSFLGLMCGDHTKSGINSMFTTGTTAGICGILVKEWFLPNFIPSFSWGGGKDSPVYKPSRAIETAKIVLNRRNKSLLDEEIALMNQEYELRKK